MEHIKVEKRVKKWKLEAKASQDIKVAKVKTEAAIKRKKDMKAAERKKHSTLLPKDNRYYLSLLKSASNELKRNTLAHVHEINKTLAKERYLQSQRDIEKRIALQLEEFRNYKRKAKDNIEVELTINVIVKPKLSRAERRHLKHTLSNVA